MSQQTNDVWDTAADTTMGPKRYFGQVMTDAFFVYISNGESKVVFDPAQHSPSKKFTQIKIGAMCTKNDGSTYDIDREIICEFGREWAGIVLPSLKKLNVHPRDLDDKWASWEMVNTGRTWKNANDETVEGTTFKFAEFYPDEATCRAAEAKFYNRPDEPVADPLDTEMPMPPIQEDTDKKRAELAGFLSMFWDLAGKDPIAFYAKIAADDALKNIFDSNSPEVVAIVEGGA